jgi:uncharacterized protein (TIGR02145 family)
MSFSEAKKQSQAEILAIFGFTAPDMDNSEALDISIDNEGNAILLAISVIFQGYRSVGDLTELLAAVANDLSTDGVINNIGTIESLRESAIEIDLPGIRQNLESRYEALGITASIPGFEKYVTDFCDFSVFAGKKPDATTDIATYIAADSSLLNGTVNANSISTTVSFEYGTDVNYGNSVIASQSPLNSMYALHVGAAISGLMPGTTYHYRIVATNSIGTTTGDDMSFTTLGKIPTILRVQSNVDTASATLFGDVNANDLSTLLTFEYGITSAYGDTAMAKQSPLTGNYITHVSAELKGLNPGTLYHFRLKSVNALGTVNSDDATFTTLGGFPTAGTEEASAVITTAATLNGLVYCNNLSTKVTFEYGTTDAYGSSVAISPPSDYWSNLPVSTNVSGLSPGTLYHFRVVAVNSLGTTFGSDMTFLTAPTSVTDADGNTYNVVIIGSQVWIAENLKTTKYQNGDLIGTTTPATLGVSTEITPKYQWAYDGDESNAAIYGRLYSFYAITDSRKLCPAGWHIPRGFEWTTLFSQIHEGGKLKEWGTAHWHSPNTGATDEMNFTALPGGRRTHDTHYSNDIFENIGYDGYWWSYNSESLPLFVQLSHSSSSVINSYKDFSAFSVRCIWGPEN